MHPLNNMCTHTNETRPYLFIETTRTPSVGVDSIMTETFLGVVIINVPSALAIG